MKSYNFKLTEHCIGGEKPPRVIEMKGRDQKAAFEKVRQLFDSLKWSIEAVPKGAVK